MTLRFAVVYESQADFRTGTELADRVLLESIDWLDDQLFQINVNGSVSHQNQKS